jgi:hypothetical protein
MSVRIPLSNSPLYAVVDEDAARSALALTWRLDRHGYVVKTCWRRGEHSLLHRLLMAAPRHLYVDHRDRDPLNNRRTNLRLVTPAESALNKGRRPGTSVFRGVAWVEKSRRWQVYLNQRYIGLFADETTAAAAWIAAAAPVYGEENVARDRVVLSERLASLGRS